MTEPQTCPTRIFIRYSDDGQHIRKYVTLPEGWRPQPLQPTAEMIEAGIAAGRQREKNWITPFELRLIWNAMVFTPTRIPVETAPADYSAQENRATAAIVATGLLAGDDAREAARAVIAAGISINDEPDLVRDAYRAGFEQALHNRSLTTDEFFDGWVCNGLPASQRTEPELNRDWVPKIGEPVQVSASCDPGAEWATTKLWVAGLCVAENGDGLNVTVAEQWPVPSRHASAYMGQTDCFYVGRANAPDDLVPLLRRSHPIATVEKIETVPIDHPFGDHETPPIWRIVIGGYCADFDFEAAARNFAGAINSAGGDWSEQPKAAPDQSGPVTANPASDGADGGVTPGDDDVKLLREQLEKYQEFAGTVAGTCLGLAMSSDHPAPDRALMELFEKSQALLYPASAANSEAKQ